MSKNIYLTDEYVENVPNLHIQDSVWKTEKIIPFIDKIDFSKKKQISILDVGGGAGEILKLISNYINAEYKINLKKYMLDLSPKMLNIQKKVNSDYYQVFNEDIRHTSISDKEIDITLMIDVLENIPKPELALKELKRISSYVIFKVPLENNLVSRLRNKIWTYVDTPLIVTYHPAAILRNMDLFNTALEDFQLILKTSKNQ